MWERFLSKREYTSYEDFVSTCRITVPEQFNYAYDVVDAWAAEAPDKTALVWCDEAGNEASFTFAEMKEQSDRAAALFAELGIGRGDAVMLILRRRYQYWFCVLALHKLGAIAIPATHLLTARSLTATTRNNVRMIVAATKTALPMPWTPPSPPAQSHTRGRRRAPVGSTLMRWAARDSFSVQPQRGGHQRGYDVYHLRHDRHVHMAP